MNKRQLIKLKKSRDFQKMIRKQGFKEKKKNTFLIILLIALIVYLIFAGSSIYLIIGLTILLVLLMR